MRRARLTSEITRTESRMPPTRNSVTSQSMKGIERGTRFQRKMMLTKTHTAKMSELNPTALKISTNSCTLA